MRLQQRVIIVTGGASGIGKAIAIKAASEGASVIIADICENPVEGGETTINLIKRAGGEASFKFCDVNAAAHGRSALLETTEEEWDAVMAVGAKGMFFGCKRAVQEMLKQTGRNNSEVRGRIINISSQHGMLRAPFDFAYGVSKACAVYMTKQIAGDYASDGIVCNAVAPGKIITGRKGAPVTPEAISYSRARTPWPRLGKPEDVASAVVFLASDDASFITGENLMVDGGWMAS